MVKEMTLGPIIQSKGSFIQFARSNNKKPDNTYIIIYLRVSKKSSNDLIKSHKDDKESINKIVGQTYITIII
jgi:hypothetical protein